MTFQQVEAVTGQPWPYTGSPLSQFKIDGKQFDGSCVNVTTVLNTSRTWTVSNATRLPHPFHIHTNPFALLNYGGASLKPGGRPEPIWMDTMPLPLAKLVPCADPKNCPTAIPCKIGKPELCTLQESSMTFEQRYEEFTGEYVLHCHFLGHEDRGMMFAVQTVCQNNQSFFGLAGVAVSECNGKLLPKVKPCP
jgi:L-ascorbate oxidase